MAKMGLNQFADLSNEEFQLIMPNSHSNVNLRKLTHPINKNSTLSDLPKNIDWRKKGAVTPVKIQLDCGDSWAFSATGGLEALHFFKNGTLLSFSEQQLLDCALTLPPGEDACNGLGTIEQMYEYVEDKGIETEDVYPYKGEVQTCAYNKSNVAFKISGYESVEPENNDALAIAVSQQPVSVMVEVLSEEFQLYKSGILNSPWCGTMVNHSVLVVGYGRQGGLDYWIVKNSWGESWGDKGYIKIFREHGKNPGVCGIATVGFYPVV